MLSLNDASLNKKKTKLDGENMNKFVILLGVLAVFLFSSNALADVVSAASIASEDAFVPSTGNVVQNGDYPDCDKNPLDPACIDGPDSPDAPAPAPAPVPAPAPSDSDEGDNCTSPTVD